MENFKNESGRSMVEMLGTLAIIGVLSIGGIVGYSYGMDKYRANTIMNDVNLRAIDLIAQVNRGGDLSLSEWPEKSTAGYIITLEKGTDGITGGIKISGIEKQVCEMLAKDLLPQNTTLKINGADYTSDDCGETNTLIFYYDTIMAGVEEICNGPVVDGECGTCSSPFIWDGTNCVCPSSHPYWRSDYNICCTSETSLPYEENSLCPNGQIFIRSGNQPYGCKDIGWCEKQGGTYTKNEFYNCSGLGDGPEAGVNPSPTPTPSPKG